MAGRYPASSTIAREDCLLLLIDLQEKLLPVIAEKEEVVVNAVRLLQFSRIISLPVLLTEQENLGETVGEIRSLLPEAKPVSKLHFDCFGCGEFEERIYKAQRKTLIVAGIEAHICILQTVLHALPHFTVHVAADAVSSRTLQNRAIALERMRDLGAVMTSTEAVIFQLLRRAGTDEFRATLPLVK
jgi:nicotinamidase-related amidase